MLKLKKLGRLETALAHLDAKLDAEKIAKTVKSIQRIKKSLKATKCKLRG